MSTKMHPCVMPTPRVFECSHGVPTFNDHEEILYKHTLSPAAVHRTHTFRRQNRIIPASCNASICAISELEVTTCAHLDRVPPRMSSAWATTPPSPHPRGSCLQRRAHREGIQRMWSTTLNVPVGLKTAFEDRILCAGAAARTRGLT